MNQLFDNRVFFIVPLSLKKQLLRQLALEKTLYDIHFATMEEVEQHYFFTFKEEAVLYLLEKTGEPLSVVRSFLSSLSFLEDQKVYKHPKLQQLQQIKQWLVEADLLVYDTSFADYLASFTVKVLGYPLLEPYQKAFLAKVGASIVDFPRKRELPSVYACETMREEIVALATHIRALNAKGVSYQDIFITGVDPSYHYFLKQMMAMFDIPFVFPKQHSLLMTLAGAKYYETRDLALVKEEGLRQQIASIEKQLAYAKTSSFYDTLLYDQLQHSYLIQTLPFEAVTVLPTSLEAIFSVTDEQYLFIVGLRQNQLPKVYRDDDFLSDAAKKEVGLFTSDELNQREKQAFIKGLTSITHVSLSYSLVSLQGVFYPSSIIEEFHLPIIKEASSISLYSDLYNRYYLGMLLDTYYKYHQQSPLLGELVMYYDTTTFGAYQHQFQKFSRPVTPFVLSYSTIDQFAKCPFRYYASQVLQLEKYTVTFGQKVGNLYHGVLAKIYDANFDFEETYTQVAATIDWEAKERFLLSRLQEELRFIVEVIKKQEENSSLKNAFVEKRLVVTYDEQVSLKGFIDKILYREQNGKTYFAIVDYKTGKASIHLAYLEAGLYLQLPFYLYLIHQSNLFIEPIFAGFFYQMLLQNAKETSQKVQNLRLVGVGNASIETLSYLDDGYENSQWIKGLSLTKEGQINSRFQVLNDASYQRLLTLVDTVIKRFSEQIKDSAFFIAPKVVHQQNVSCQYCPFGELCYHDYNDLVDLDRKEEVHA